MLVPVISEGKGDRVLKVLGLILMIVILMQIMESEFKIPVHKYLKSTIGESRFFGLLFLLIPGLPMVWMGIREHMRGVFQYIEPETGRVKTKRHAHSFYFINVYYWGALFSMLGLYLIYLETKSY